jgi:ABC-type lipoprotein export system ATPase subunit
MSAGHVDRLFELERVSFSYDGGKTYALRDVSLSIRQGMTTAILGLSGSGKSTLLNLMALLSDGAGYEGTIKYRGLAHGGSPEKTAALRRSDFGFVLQSAYMLRHFTCGHNVGMPLALRKFDGREVDDRVCRMLRSADPRGRLLGLRDSLARDVSGGERQRMAVLRAVVHDPQVVFADEPLASLDPRNAAHILKLFADWKAGRLQTAEETGVPTECRSRSLILVTHDIAVAWEHADEFVFLVDGRAIGNRVWTKQELKGPEAIKDLLRLAADSLSQPVAATAPAQSLPESPAGHQPNGNQAGEQGRQPGRRHDGVRPRWSAWRGLARSLSWVWTCCRWLGAHSTGRQAWRSTCRDVSFYGWFAWRNLVERQAWRSTFINLVSVAAVLILVILSFGATWGVEEARLQELRDDPLNLCLWVGSRTTEPQFNRKRVEDLAAGISSRVAPDTFVGCCPFSETDFVWHENEAGGVRGRAVRPG